MVISQLGINPIPFVEYVNSGKVPYAASSETTSRIGWKDIWGRSWYQPMRTTYPDFIPIPPPVKNLVMSTTSIVNWSRLEKRKFETTLKLPLTTNKDVVEKIRKRIEFMLENDEEILKDDSLTSMQKVSDESPALDV